MEAVDVGLFVELVLDSPNYESLKEKAVAAREAALAAAKREAKRIRDELEAERRLAAETAEREARQALCEKGVTSYVSLQPFNSPIQNSKLRTRISVAFEVTKGCRSNLQLPEDDGFGDKMKLVRKAVEVRLSAVSSESIQAENFRRDLEADLLSVSRSAHGNDGSTNIIVDKAFITGFSLE